MQNSFSAAGLFDQWTAMWNGRRELAPQIMAPRFRLRYAQPQTEPMDHVQTPGAIVELIASWREMRGQPVFRAEGEVVIRGDDQDESGIVVRPYATTFTTDGVTKDVSGIDMLIYEKRLIIEVLSASGGANGRSFGL